MWFMLVNVENSSTSWPRLRLSQRFFGVKSLNGTIRVCGDPRSSSNGHLYHSDLNNNYGTMNNLYWTVQIAKHVILSARMLGEWYGAFHFMGISRDSVSNHDDLTMFGFDTN